MIEQKLLGTTLVSTAEFKNESMIRIIPTTVNIKYKKPAGQIVTIQVQPTVDEKFTASILLDEPGTWNFRWESVSGNTVAEEFSIAVLDTTVK